IPFTVKQDPALTVDEYVYIPDIRDAVLSGKEQVIAYVSATKEDALQRTDKARAVRLYMEGLSDDERDVLAEGCMINYYRKSM
ncbi:MAG TPA: hypothetical protein P5064_05540, partial [Clostridia bacterium]|nr:hypothetical protein [Clostridia bacterium]